MNQLRVAGRVDADTTVSIPLIIYTMTKTDLNSRCSVLQANVLKKFGLIVTADQRFFLQDVEHPRNLIPCSVRQGRPTRWNKIVRNYPDLVPGDVVLLSYRYNAHRDIIFIVKFKKRDEDQDTAITELYKHIERKTKKIFDAGTPTESLRIRRQFPQDRQDNRGSHQRPLF